MVEPNDYNSGSESDNESNSSISDSGGKQKIDEDEDDYDDEVEEEEVDGGSLYGGDDEVEENNIPPKLFNGGEFDDSEDDADDDNDENYLQKFSENIKKDIISDYHPELKSHNYEEVETLCKIVKNENGVIVDPLHKTLPFITKYEKTRILGERAKQLNAGAKSFIEVDNSMIDGYLIALKEYQQKKIPFIIRRPIPDGTCEYWKLKDLEMLD